MSQEEEIKIKEENLQEKVETGENDKDSDSDDHAHDGHDHGHEGHDHGHEGHDHKDGEHDPTGKKSNRGEKKFKKAMLKLGMKPMSGINRITLKKGKNLLLYLDDPEVLKAPNADNSYIIFGEFKINDFANSMAQSEASKFKPSKPSEQATELQQQQVPVADQGKQNQGEEDVSEEGLKEEDIKFIMEHSKVNKITAIKALKEAEGDKVNAILKLSDH